MVKHRKHNSKTEEKKSLFTEKNKGDKEEGKKRYPVWWQSCLGLLLLLALIILLIILGPFKGRPAFDAAPRTVTTAKINATGYNALPNSRVGILVNETDLWYVIADDDGTFSSVVVLEDGLNTIQAIITTPEGEDTTYDIDQVVYVPQGPSLTIISPDDGAIIDEDQDTILVVGETDPDATVTVDGEEVPVDDEGNFEDEVDLDDGENTIDIIAEDDDGTTEEVITVIVGDDPSGGGDGDGGSDDPSDGGGDTPPSDDGGGEDTPDPDPVTGNISPIASISITSQLWPFVTFNASGSNDPDGTIVSYTWSFGDGATAVTTDPTVIHEYATRNPYVANVVVTDNESATGQAYIDVTFTKVIISYLLYSNDVVGEDGEYIELRNTGDKAEDVTGWTIKDSNENAFVFSSLTLTPGQTVRVTTGESGFSFLQSGPIWNTVGEPAYLYNALGQLVDIYSY